MKKGSILKTTLYLGVILLLFMISISFNSLRVLALNGTKTIRIAQDRFKLDDLESQIKDAINNNPKNQAFPRNKIHDLDEKFFRFGQQLEGGKLPRLEIIRQEWDQLKNQPSPDPTEMIKELELLHKVVNKNILEDIAKREAVSERDVSQLRVLKIASGTLIIFLVFIAMYLDTIQSKQKEELLKRLQAFEKEGPESLNPRIDYSSPESVKNVLENI